MRKAKLTPGRILSVSIAALLIDVAGTALAHKAKAPAGAAGEPVDIDDDIVLGPHDKFLGDFPKIAERGQIRVLVSHSKTDFFIVDGRGRGFEHDLMQEFEKFLNIGRKRRERGISLLYVPVAFERLIPALLAGEGDIAAAGLTVTRERQKKVAFSEPYLADVDEVLVSHKDRRAVSGWSDLKGAQVHVPRATSYAEHARKIKGIKVVEAAPMLKSEDLLEMINGKLLDYTVVDNHVAELWSRVLPNIAVHREIMANQNGRIAWAVRKNNPALLAKLNVFVTKELPKRRKRVRSLFGTYYKGTKWAKNPLPITFSKRFEPLLPIYKQRAEQYRFHWLLIMAQSYQESGFRIDAKSHTGAIGLMQVLPETGKDMGIANVHPPGPNIHAGVKYMRWIVKNYFNDANLPPAERVYFALAAYNAGPNRVARLRKKAPAMGLDPNRWFGHMELVVLLNVSREPVHYVSNINKYYIKYRALQEDLEEKAKAKMQK